MGAAGLRLYQVFLLEAHRKANTVVLRIEVASLYNVLTIVVTARQDRFIFKVFDVNRRRILPVCRTPCQAQVSLVITILIVTRVKLIQVASVVRITVGDIDRWCQRSVTPKVPGILSKAVKHHLR